MSFSAPLMDALWSHSGQRISGRAARLIMFYHSKVAPGKAFVPLMLVSACNDLFSWTSKLTFHCWRSGGFSHVPFALWIILSKASSHDQPVHKWCLTCLQIPFQLPPYKCLHLFLMSRLIIHSEPSWCPCLTFTSFSDSQLLSIPNSWVTLRDILLCFFILFH